jgi:hypothetical protein
MPGAKPHPHASRQAPYAFLSMWVPWPSLLFQRDDVLVEFIEVLFPHGVVR